MKRGKTLQPRIIALADRARRSSEDRGGGDLLPGQGKVDGRGIDDRHGVVFQGRLQRHIGNLLRDAAIVDVELVRIIGGDGERGQRANFRVGHALLQQQIIAGFQQKVIAGFQQQGIDFWARSRWRRKQPPHPGAKSAA